MMPIAARLQGPRAAAAAGNNSCKLLTPSAALFMTFSGADRFALNGGGRNDVITLRGGVV